MQQLNIPAMEPGVWKQHLPALAPLPEAFVAHLYGNPGALILPRSQEPLDHQIWKQIQAARINVSYVLLSALSVKGDITVDWFKKNFNIYAGKERILPRTTVDDWLKRHLLRSVSHGILDPSSVASVFMLRYLFLKDYRSWLPTRQSPDAPWFYVWGLQPDDLVPRMYPYPLPENLPANTLFWSQWIGSGELPGWCKVPGIGALAWKRSIQHGNNWYWNLSEDDLVAWDRSLVRDASVQRRIEMFEPIFREHRQQSPLDPEHGYRFTRLHTLATLILQHVGEPILAGYVQHYFSSGKPPTQHYKPF